MRLLVGSELQEVVKQAVSSPIGIQVNDTEVDIHFGAFYYQEVEEPHSQRIHVMKKERWEHLWNRHAVPETGITLAPGEIVLAETLERFDLPHNIQANLTLRSWAAKSGLDQSTSLVLKPGFKDYLILEMHNAMRKHLLMIEPNEAIAQLQFFKIVR